MENMTPAMRQYLEVKAKNKDAIVFFRMGDFYEIFFDDAVVASRALGIALTSRDREKKIPMCGVPYHSASPYIARLVKEGFKVAICEQAARQNGKGLFERTLTRVITPGTVIEDELMSTDARSNNFIAAVSLSAKRCGLAYMDVSTGEFRVTEFTSIPSVQDEIRRLKPLELLINGTENPFADVADFCIRKITPLKSYDFDLDESTRRLTGQFKTLSLDGFGISDLLEGVKAAGALLGYVKDAQRSELRHVLKCLPYSVNAFLAMDHATRRNLEITENLRTGAKEGSLLHLLDRTSTAMGGRRLKSWLLNPLKDRLEIDLRLDAVSELSGRRETLRLFQKTLSDGVYDIERLLARVSTCLANPRDVVLLKTALETCPRIKEALVGFNSALLKEVNLSIDPCREAAEIISGAIVEIPPHSVKDGGVIKTGFNRGLDELREISSGGKDWLGRLESDERRRTGIGSLKVGYNRIFGYYIEVTNANLANIPSDYIRKQTLSNAERFVTPQLKEWEERIVTAEERCKAIEAELFASVVDDLSRFAHRLQKTAEGLSVIDALASLASVSLEFGYTRPIVDDGDVIRIENGRHPVVEANLKTGGEGGFVANGIHIDNAENQVLILTGPNMSGKSTYLRQNALIVLMAQTGSFVPASSAHIGVVDRIFSRIGASDDLAKGESTFMVEMNETANILNNATNKSLVILDEIGRGTSTFDGLSIAWAVVEYLHDKPSGGPKTLFATHYHELTELPLTKERVKNYNVSVRQKGADIVFLKKVVPGASESSYGIHVARLAGIPDSVIKRAGEILENLESFDPDGFDNHRLAKPGKTDLAGPSDEAIAIHDELKGMDVNAVTPLEALNLLHKLKGLLKTYE